MFRDKHQEEYEDEEDGEGDGDEDEVDEEVLEEKSGKPPGSATQKTLTEEKVSVLSGVCVR
jgi:hypothetical protein